MVEQCGSESGRRNITRQYRNWVVRGLCVNGGRWCTVNGNNWEDNREVEMYEKGGKAEKYYKKLDVREIM